MNPTSTATPSMAPNAAVNAKPEVLALAEHLTLINAAALSPSQVGEAWFTTVPPNYKLQDITEAIEKAQPDRNRKSGNVTVKDLNSLLVYAKDQACTSKGYIYADTDTRQFVAVFNDNKAMGDRGGWRDHRCTYKAEFTPEFDRWLRNNGPAKSFAQLEFAEFIEANFVDIAGDQAQTLLDVSTTLQAKTDINFSSSKRLDNGQAQLTYTESINATAGANGSVTIPKGFDLGLRLFKNGEGYKIKARLKYRLVQGGVKFWYELDRPERAIEDAFNGYIEQVTKESDYTVLIGTP